MKNKTELKKYLNIICIVILIFIVLLMFLSVVEYKIYTKNFNNVFFYLIQYLEQNYPDFSKEDIMQILNYSKEQSLNIAPDLFKDIGVNIEEESIVIDNNKYNTIFLIYKVILICFCALIIVGIFLVYNYKKDKYIKDITKYIEQINKKNYELEIDSISEDELSILKNEIYKTTIMLKESAENSKKDKINLKKSLEDISHQLKTPLTSILIMLDNLMDYKNMEESVRIDFIREIRKEILSMNFFVQEILKLSKFDANTIVLYKENILVEKVLSEAVKKVSALCDLKNIKIDISLEEENIIIFGDFNWEVEAIINILKNCIEHSKENKNILINVGKTNVYTWIKIKDFGEGISEKDINHIFERFYEASNSNLESTHIGLALSKSIIKEDNGTINVESRKDGTTFIIKYFNI